MSGIRNPELLPGEAPLSERLLDAANDVDDAIKQFAVDAYEQDEITLIYALSSAGISLGRALSKVITILRDEAGVVDDSHA